MNPKLVELLKIDMNPKLVELLKIDMNPKLVELLRNHDVFREKYNRHNYLKNMKKVRLNGYKDVWNSMELILAKNRSYGWLNLHGYEHIKNFVPDTISKYLNNSSEFSDYITGDSGLFICQFPKTIFPTYPDIVKHLEEEYFMQPQDIEDGDTLQYLLQSNNFHLSDKGELICDIYEIYINGIRWDSGLGHLFVDDHGLAHKTSRIDYSDLLPGGKGYNGEKRTVRLRCIFQCDGNECDALFETDICFIYRHSEIH